MINPRAMRRRGGKRMRHIHIKIRLAKRGGKPTRGELLETVDYILANGEVPEGWTFQATNWANDDGPEKEGGISDLENFRHILSAWRDSLQFAIVQVAG